MSNKIGILVQARMSSSRLPGKVLKEIGDKPLIWYIFKRLESLGLPIIVCTSIEETDDVIYNYLHNKGVMVFRGSLKNVLRRYIEAAEAYGIDSIVRVTGDNPFIDVTYLKDSLHLFNFFDYVDGIYHGGLIKGVGFELVKLDTLKNIPEPNTDQKEHVTLWLRENLTSSQKFIKLLPNNINAYRSDIILTCDYLEDFKLISEIFRHFHYNFDVEIFDILNLMESRGDLRILNKDLH